MGTSDQLAAMKAAKAEAILNEGLAFLESNKNKPGVIVLPSGLQYEIITEGSGVKPTATQTVTCHYHGTLTNGTVFDSSVKRGAPASFPLNRVISGWTEALQLMPVGSKWRLFLPPQLAYGSMQVGSIPANSTLIFEVELLSIS
jgi:FKBP-type peptidyl-prolyl cis-trans isomerase FklB